MDPEKIIICDIDSTMSDHWVRIRRNTIPRWPGVRIDAKAWTRDEVLRDRLLPHCNDVLRILVNRGFYVRYLTARSWPNARRITIEQLEQWEVPNPQDVLICMTMADKAKILNKKICDYYIDDFMTGQEKSIGTFHKEIAQAIENKGIHVIVFRNDWLDIFEQIKIYVERERQ